MAERENRLLAAAAERDRRAGELEAQREQRLLDDARHARELEAQREQSLVRDAQTARQELLADIQLQRGHYYCCADVAFTACYACYAYR